MNATCPSADELRMLLLATTAEDDITARHVEQCPHCQHALERLTTPTQPVRPVPEYMPPPDAEASGQFLQRLMQEGPTFNSLRGGLSFLSTTTPGTAAEPRPLPVIPDYEILGELGSGGMGIVYRARQIGLNRLIALKMLRTDDDPENLARFRSEAEAVARLQHPNIVQIHDIGTVEGRPYFCLEYVSGGTLAQRMAVSPLSHREAAALIATLARAMHHAHEQGIVHRDLKPSNILLAVSDPRSAISQTQKLPDQLMADNCKLNAIPKITDFGLAKSLDEKVDHTKSGHIMGTPDYMAPEQASGRSRRIGPAVDVHALGVILYQLLTGRLPYQGETQLETLLQVIHAEPVPPRRLQPKVPPDLETIVHKCLEKEPARRYGTAQHLAEDLERFLTGEAISARPPSVFYHWKKFARRNKGLVGSVIATLAVLAAGLIATGFFASRESQLRQEADANARSAEHAREAARREAYQARLMAALGLLQDQRVAEAALQLQAAPSDLRGWEWRHLHARLDDSIRRQHLPPEHDRVTVAATPHGWRVLSLHAGHGAWLWDLERPDARIPVDAGPALQCWTLTSRAESLFLLEASPYPGPLVIVDVQGKVRLRLSIARNSFINAVALSPEGALIAVAPHNEKWFDLYDMATGNLRHRIENTTKAHTTALAFSSDGTRLAWADSNGNLALLEIATGKRTYLARRHRSQVTALAFHPDGTRLASGGDDRLLCQWDATSGRLLGVQRGHLAAITAAQYSPDGRWLASAGRDGGVRLWSVADEETSIVLKGHTTPVVRLLWRPDSSALATATEQGIRLWGVMGQGTPGILTDHRASVYAAAYSADGRFIATGGWDSRVRLWDADSGAPLAVFPTPDWVASVAISPDGKTLVSRNFSTTLCIWDVPSRRLRKTIEHHGFIGQDLMHTVAISPDGRTIAAPGGQQIHRWDAASLEEKPAFTVPAEHLRLAVYSPDGKTLAVVGGDHVIHLLDAESGQVRRTLAGHQGMVQVLAFHPDGRRLVSGGGDRRVRIWETQTGNCLHDLRGHTGEIFGAAFHPDGTRLVTGGRDRVIRIWEVNSGDALLRLEGSRGVVFTLVFSPDGRTLVSALGDTTVRLWDDFPTGQRLRSAPPPDKP